MKAADFESVAKHFFPMATQVEAFASPHTNQTFICVWFALDMRRLKKASLGSNGAVIEEFVGQVIGEYSLKENARKVLNAPVHSFSVRAGRRRCKK